MTTDFNGHRGIGTVKEVVNRVAKYAMIAEDGSTGNLSAKSIILKLGK